MADEPISALTLIGTPPYSSNFTTNNPTGGTGGAGGAQLEILDTTNTTMASTGTNSRIFPSDMLSGFAFERTNAYAAVPSGQNYTIGTSMGNLSTDLSITLPVAGTYMIWAAVRDELSLTGTTAGGYVYVVAQFYDSTNSAAVTNSQVLLFLTTLQVTASSVSWPFQTTAAIGPILYTVTGSTVLHLQGFYGSSGVTVASGAGFASDANGFTSISAMRIY
jgi:hypothetical protein